jgi:hypothetical protein
VDALRGGTAEGGRSRLPLRGGNASKEALPPSGSRRCISLCDEDTDLLGGVNRRAVVDADNFRIDAGIEPVEDARGEGGGLPPSFIADPSESCDPPNSDGGVDDVRPSVGRRRADPDECLESGSGETSSDALVGTIVELPVAGETATVSLLGLKSAARSGSRFSMSMLMSLVTCRCDLVFVGIVGSFALALPLPLSVVSSTSITVGSVRHPLVPESNAFRTSSVSLAVERSNDPSFPESERDCCEEDGSRSSWPISGDWDGDLDSAGRCFEMPDESASIIVESSAGVALLGEGGSTISTRVNQSVFRSAMRSLKCISSYR